MKKTNKELFEENRQTILNSLPATLCDLKAKLDIHENTIYNHLKVLKAENIIHVAHKVKRYDNGPMVDYYVLGPKPLDQNVVYYKQPDVIPKPDLLTAYFFGLTRKQNAKTF